MAKDIVHNIVILRLNNGLFIGHATYKNKWLLQYIFDTIKIDSLQPLPKLEVQLLSCE
jgi:hypothetical protein